MARDPQLKEKKKERIIEYYNKLINIKEFGEKKYTTMWCIAATGNHFFLKPNTIMNYIYS